MPTLRHVQLLIQCGDHALFSDLQDAYFHIPIVTHHHFLHFLWHNVPYQWKVLPFRLATAPRVFMALTKPILFLCHQKGFRIVIYLDDILVQVCSMLEGKRACLFLCSLLVCLGLHINFSKSDLHLTQTFCFLGSDKLADIQWPILYQWLLPTVHLGCVIQSDMLQVYHSPTHLFSCVYFSLSSLCQLECLAHLQQSPVPSQFPLTDVVIATDATPTQWAFYFQVSGLPLLVSGS